MNRPGNRLWKLHRFLAQRTFYPLALSSALAAALLAARIIQTGEPTFHFMLWNLVLAWVPYGFSLWAERIDRHGGGWRVLPVAAIWLLFFPNAPYILTDFVHVRHVQTSFWWYDVGLVAAFAWTGCFLAIVSLQLMQAIVRRHAGRLVSWLFVLATVGLGGLGIYLGRFARLNSWDLLTDPRGVLASLVTALDRPLAEPRALGVTVLFSALLLIFYLTFSAPRPGHQPERGERRPLSGD